MGPFISQFSHFLTVGFFKFPLRNFWQGCKILGVKEWDFFKFKLLIFSILGGIQRGFLGKTLGFIGWEVGRFGKQHILDWV